MSIENTSKTEWEWSIIEQSTVVQKTWEDLLERLLGEVADFPTAEEVQQHSWWPYACWSLFEIKDNETIRMQGKYKAKRLIDTVFFVRSLAKSSQKTELYNWFKRGLFDAFLFRLCTTQKPSRLSKRVYSFIKNRSLDMVDIKNGSYWIGSSKDQGSAPFHMIKTGSFSIGTFPVTQLLWFDVMGTTPSKYKGSTRPVEQISWTEAIVFCNTLSQKEGRDPYYEIDGSSVYPIKGSNGYRLPTEAQWEIAARSEKSYGNAKSEQAQSWMIDQQGWINQSSGTRPIGQKRSNPSGIFDIYGNVFEWCWDIYGSYRNMVMERGIKTPYFMRNPEYNKGSKVGLYRCYRGGCWNLSADYALPYRRMAGRIDIKSNGIGLRICCTN